ncbi:hypothetical protein LDENG_00095130 [Lucifuga dentata]|nr:hypothetical protein LDENG_00095130 [Lucifuga dentata]
MAKSDGCDYFERTRLFWIITVTISMGYFTCIVFVPEKIPYESLGLFGTFSRNLVDNHADIMYKGWVAGWIVHFFEAIIAMRLCSQKGITDTATSFLWFIQTLLFGFASLALLIKYDPKHPKQH